MRPIAAAILAAACLAGAGPPAEAYHQPFSARSTRCLGLTLGVVSTVLVLASPGTAGPFVAIAGELVAPALGLSAPVAGTGHLRPDGGFHFGLAVLGSSSPAPADLEGVLDGPDHTSGTGSLRVLTPSESVTAVTFAPAGCPEVPE